jgi:hypothetical protein
MRRRDRPHLVVGAARSGRRHTFPQILDQPDRRAEARPAAAAMQKPPVRRLRSPPRRASVPRSLVAASAQQPSRV